MAEVQTQPRQATRIGSAVVKTTPELRVNYLASRRGDLREVAQIARDLPKPRKVQGVILAHELGLMLPRGKLRIAMWFFRTPRARSVFMQQMFQRDEPATLNLWEQTLLHMTSGKDREDTDSVGGWSQRELDIFTKQILPRLVR
jgi:hypothetical protein